ncbi:hypothetical protein JCM9279_006276 [Rhodotorula babjevae]
MSYVLGTGLPPGVRPPPAAARLAPPAPPRRAHLGDDFGDDAAQAVPASVAKPKWHDIRYFRTSSKTYLLNAPAAALDRIFSHPAFTLRDHLALAATCRALRACYWTAPGTSTPDDPPSSPLWAGLIALRRGPAGGEDGEPKICSSRERRAVMGIYSRGVRVDAESFEVIGAAQDRAVGGSNWRKRSAVGAWEGSVIRSAEWSRAILLVQSTKITRTNAKAHYKLTDVDLSCLKHIVEPNTHARRTAAPVNFFVEAAVESLAIRKHGGVRAHEALLVKRAASAAKAAATRLANKAKTGGSSVEKGKGKATAEEQQQEQKHAGLSEHEMIMLVAAQERALEALRAGGGGASGSGAQVPRIEFDDDGWEMWSSGL